MEEDFYWLWICNIDKVWNATIRRILNIFGTPREAFIVSEKVLRSELSKIAGMNEKVINIIVQSRNREAVWRLHEKLNQKGVRFIHCESREYPIKLRHINHYPYGLYIKGCIADLSGVIDGEKRHTVSIVGARNCTAYGRKMAGDLGYELATKGVNVVSGMAVGIDGAGHWGALRACHMQKNIHIGGSVVGKICDMQEYKNVKVPNEYISNEYIPNEYISDECISNECTPGKSTEAGITIAVLGSGVDICYPIQNFELYQNIMQNGIVISEYPLGTKPMAWQFPQRNRIISGLSDRIIVVEAREKSGSLITVEYGLEQGKDIYAVPGRIGDSLSSGCNRLIQEGAGILTNTENIMRELELGELYPCKISKNKNIVLEKDLELVYSCVDYFPKSVEYIIEETGMEMTQVYRNIITLQLMGLIDEQTKNHYVRTW